MTKLADLDYLDIHIECNTIFSLNQLDYLEEYFVWLLKADPSEEGLKQKVGFVQAHVLLAEDAILAGTNLYDWLDYEDVDLGEIAKALFWKGGDFRIQNLKKWEDPLLENVLILQRVAIAPAFRGNDLSLALVNRTCEIVGRSCQLAVLQPGNFEKYSAIPDKWLSNPPSIPWLVKHWKKIGFEQIGRSKIYGRKLGWC